MRKFLESPTLMLKPTVMKLKLWTEVGSVMSSWAQNIANQAGDLVL